MPQSENTPSKPKSKGKTADRHYAEVTADVHKQLGKAAKSCGLTKAAYASAAIGYFAERELNPASDRVREGLVIQGKIHDLEKVITTLGNRIFGWLTQHEKNLNRDLFGFLRSHEKSLFTYLQTQEQNLHEHLGDQEEMFFVPLMRELILTNIEALDSKRLALQSFMKLIDRDVEKEYPAKNTQYSQRRDQEAASRFNEFIGTLTPDLPRLASTPQLTPIPERQKATTKPTESAAPNAPADSF